MPAATPTPPAAPVTAAPATQVPQVKAPGKPKLSPKTLAEQEVGRDRLKLHGNP